MGNRSLTGLVTVPRWTGFGWLRHGFTTRHGGETTVYGADGELNLGFTAEDEAPIVQANRNSITREVGGPAFALATLRQVHGTAVLPVTEPGPAGAADGLVTATRGILLAAMTADCVPILLADVRQRVVAALHAGWRGTAAGMVAAGVERMVALGARREDLVAAVGPSIGPCCYEVGDEVREAFRHGPDGVREGDADLFRPGNRLDSWKVNLWESNRRQLVAAGVLPYRVTGVGECTACARLPTGERRYFSHRAEHGRTGRMMALIGIAPE